MFPLVWVQTIDAVDCKINFVSIKNNETFCHQLVLIRANISCSTVLTSYPNDIDPTKGRFVKVRTPLNAVGRSWPVNSYNQFKVLIRLENKIDFININ